MPRVIWQGRMAVTRRDGVGHERVECRIIEGAVTKDVTLLRDFPGALCGLTVERLGKDAMGGPLWIPVGLNHDGCGEFMGALATALRAMCPCPGSDPADS